MKNPSSPVSRSIAFMAVAAALGIVQASANPILPAGLNLGSDANYAFIDLGPSHLGWNSGPVAGNVLFGLGLTAQLSGGNNGGISNGGILYLDNTTNISGNLQNPITEQLVPTSVTQNAEMIATDVSNYAAGLTPTQTFGTINGATTITGNGGLNVIDVGNIQNAPFTLSGGPNDLFVINVSGAIQTNRVMTLNGVLPSQVLFNLTGNGTVFQTSGGDRLEGTFLSTNGGRFQFSNLDLTGELINVGGNVQLVSGSSIPTNIPFCTTNCMPPCTNCIVNTPEPSSLGLVGSGLLGFGWFLRKRKWSFTKSDRLSQSPLAIAPPDDTRSDRALARLL